jgi:hypothetical protein
MDRQPSAPGASAISDGSGNLAALPFGSIALSLTSTLTVTQGYRRINGKYHYSAHRILG